MPGAMPSSMPGGMPGGLPEAGKAAPEGAPGASGADEPIIEEVDQMPLFLVIDIVLNN